MEIATFYCFTDEEDVTKESVGPKAQSRRIR